MKLNRRTTHFTRCCFNFIHRKTKKEKEERSRWQDFLSPIHREKIRVSLNTCLGCGSFFHFASFSFPQLLRIEENKTSNSSTAESPAVRTTVMSNLHYTLYPSFFLFFFPLLLNFGVFCGVITWNLAVELEKEKRAHYESRWTEIVNACVSVFTFTRIFFQVCIRVFRNKSRQNEEYSRLYFWWVTASCSPSSPPPSSLSSSSASSLHVSSGRS